MRIKMLTDEQLQEIVDHPAEHSNETVVMAMEILEYRRAYGPLGCEWLESDVVIAPEHRDCDL